MNIKIITNEKEHQQAFELLMSLTETNPVVGSKESDLIEVLSLLIETFEKKEFPIELPDPVSAIEFRMDQEGLTRKDMTQYLGSKSRVSEILNRNKNLSLSMIRSLHQGLGISYDVLMQQQKFELDYSSNDYGDFPIKAAFKEGYFHKWASSITEAKEKAEEIVKELFTPVGIKPFDVSEAHLRKSIVHSNNKKVDELALSMWQAQVLTIAKEENVQKCDIDSINLDFMRSILQLSRLNNGPLIAKEELAKNGIHLVFQRHLPKTYLDGAAMWGVDENPVIGITARYDRLDNFWFVLMHELAHVSLHLKDTTNKPFFDDLDGNPISDNKEDEADELALSALMPEAEWQNYLDLLTSPESVVALAKRFNVSESIIAGRYRKDKKDYRIFNRLVGSNKVREMIFN